MKNFDRFDPVTKQLGLDDLFSCYVASKQWGQILRYGLSRKEDFVSMMSLPLKAGLASSALPKLTHDVDCSS